MTIDPTIRWAQQRSVISSVLGCLFAATLTIAVNVSVHQFCQQDFVDQVLDVLRAIETEAQRDFPSSAGCDSYQGYLLSRPLPIERFHAFCEARIASAVDG